MRWGDKQEMSRSTKNKEGGPYQRKIDIDNEQVMVFRDVDDVTFYLIDNNKDDNERDQFTRGKRK